MELFLNALWLALVVGAPAVWLSRYKRQLSRREIIAGSLAFICIAILLFPIISATDDARAFQAASEDSGVNKLSVHALSFLGLAATAVLLAAILVPDSRVHARYAYALYTYVATVQIFKRPPPCTALLAS
jgi:hypothetical protein